MSTDKIETSDTTEVRELIQNWAKAVRAKDLGGILANHSANILMFDVPPPLVSKGIEEYRKTWDLFFSWAEDPIVFDFDEVHITAGNHVAFAVALMRCAGTERTGEKIQLKFRLTVGLRKIEDQWIIVHEHHSIPAE